MLGLASLIGLAGCSFKSPNADPNLVSLTNIIKVNGERRVQARESLDGVWYDAKLYSISKKISGQRVYLCYVDNPGPDTEPNVEDSLIIEIPRLGIAIRDHGLNGLDEQEGDSMSVYDQLVSYNTKKHRTKYSSIVSDCLGALVK